MSLADRIGHKSRELRGRVKRATGRVTGDPVLEGEGLDQQVSGRLGQLGERLKDRFRGRRRR